MTKRGGVTMSEYKLKTPKGVEKTVVGVHKKIEDTVVGTYKKIEESIVGAYKKVEEKFVDTFLEKVSDKEEKKD